MPDEPRRLPHGWRIVAGIVVLAVGYGDLASAVGRYRHRSPCRRRHRSRRPKWRSPRAEARARPPTRPRHLSGDRIRRLPSPAMTTGSSHAAAAARRQAPPPRRSLPQRPARPCPTASAASGRQAGTVYGKNNRNARVVLKAKGDTHMTGARCRTGTVYINRDLKAGDSYQLPNAVGLTLSTTNAGAVEVDLDGQAMGAAGSDQQSAEDVSAGPANDRRPLQPLRRRQKDEA